MSATGHCTSCSASSSKPLVESFFTVESAESKTYRAEPSSSMAAAPGESTEVSVFEISYQFPTVETVETEPSVQTT